MDLCYIKYVGQDYKDNYIYQFLFSNDITNVNGEGWDEQPAYGKPESPLEYVEKVGTLTSDLQLELLMDSNTFSMWDGVEGLIALGWEIIEDETEYNYKRLYFTWAEDLSKVKDKLMSRGYSLKI